MFYYYQMKGVRLASLRLDLNCDGVLIFNALWVFVLNIGSIQMLGNYGVSRDPFKDS